MMITVQGNIIMRDLYDGFRRRYILRYPGVNENDVERAFLSEVCILINGELDAPTRERIEAIR